MDAYESVRSIFCPRHPRDQNYWIYGGNGDRIHCKQCTFSLDVNEVVLAAGIDPVRSIDLAHRFAEFSGRWETTPCKFTVVINDRIYPKSIVTGPNVLRKGLQMLKAINRPFLPRNDGGNDDHARALFRNFMSDYVDLVGKICSSDNVASQYLNVGIILENMKSVFHRVDFFDQYFDVLVPHVKSLASSSEESSVPPFPTEVDGSGDGGVGGRQPSFSSPGLELYRELERTELIRRRYSKYCIPFDVVYVMVLCFLCDRDTDVLYNLVLDLGARICCGHFAASPDSVEATKIDRFLRRNVTPKRNVRLYYHLQKFRRGEVEENFSADFLKCFGELDELVRKHVGVDRSEDKLAAFRYQQTFPYVLFHADVDYYGFIMALSHYASCLDPAGRTAEKNALQNARKIFRIVKKCMTRIREFEVGIRNSDDSVLLWTRDAFNLFLCSDDHFGREIAEVLEIMTTASERGKRKENKESKTMRSSGSIGCDGRGGAGGVDGDLERRRGEKVEEGETMMETS